MSFFGHTRWPHRLRFGNALLYVRGTKPFFQGIRNRQSVGLARDVSRRCDLSSSTAPNLEPEEEAMGISEECSLYWIVLLDLRWAVSPHWWNVMSLRFRQCVLVLLGSRFDLLRSERNLNTIHAQTVHCTGSELSTKSWKLSKSLGSKAYIPLRSTTTGIGYFFVR